MDEEVVVYESSRPERLSKTTAILRSKFVGDEQDYGYAAAPVRRKSKSAKPKKEKKEKRFRETPQAPPAGPADKKNVRSFAVKSKPPPAKMPAMVPPKPPPAPTEPTAKKRTSSRQLPLRRSVENRSFAAEGADGDHVPDSHFPELLKRLRMHATDVESRRRGDDPEAKRIWDTSCYVLGRGLIIGRSEISEAGFGLFATQDFKQGERVTEYTGREIDKDEAFELRRQRKDQYIRSLKNGYCIDGNRCPAVGESCAQMANDGYLDGVPNNCEFVIAHNRDVVQEKPRVYLQTIRPIAAGEELLASYGKTYWDVHFQQASSSSESPDEATSPKVGQDDTRKVIEDSDGVGGDALGPVQVSSLEEERVRLSKEVRVEKTAKKVANAPAVIGEDDDTSNDFFCIMCHEPERRRSKMVQCIVCENYVHVTCLHRKPLPGLFRCEHCIEEHPDDEDQVEDDDDGE